MLRPGRRPRFCARPGQQDCQGPCPATYVEHVIGAQFNGDAEISSQIITRSVEGIVDSRQARMSEDRIRHPQTVYAGPVTRVTEFDRFCREW